MLIKPYALPPAHCGLRACCRHGGGLVGGPWLVWDLLRCGLSVPHRSHQSQRLHLRHLGDCARGRLREYGLLHRWSGAGFRLAGPSGRHRPQRGRQRSRDHPRPRRPFGLYGWTVPNAPGLRLDGGQRQRSADPNRRLCRILSLDRRASGGRLAAPTEHAGEHRCSGNLFVRSRHRQL